MNNIPVPLKFAFGLVLLLPCASAIGQINVGSTPTPTPVVQEFQAANYQQNGSQLGQGAFSGAPGANFPQSNATVPTPNVTSTSNTPSISTGPAQGSGYGNIIDNSTNYDTRYNGVARRAPPVAEVARVASAADFMPPGVVRTVDGYTYPAELNDPSPDFLWYAAVEPIALRRDGESGAVFQTLGASPALQESGLDSDYQFGGRISIGRWLNCTHRIEASYLGFSSWQDDIFARSNTPNAQGGNGNLFSPFSRFGNPPIVGSDFNNFASISFNSHFDNFELNMHQHVVMPEGPYDLTFIYGVRYAKVKENFRYISRTATGGAASNFVNVNTDNDLFAAQIGGLLQIQVHNYWGLELEVKGGLAFNEASQSTVFNSTTNGNNLTERDENRASFLGDVNLVAAYDCGPNLSLRFGYHVTAITGVALGAENFETDLATLTQGPGRLRHDGQIFYHGPHIGLVWRH